MCPRSQSGHINCVYNLAEARWKRYGLSQEKEDLDKTISHCVEGLLLPPVSREGHLINNILELRFVLARSLLERCETFEQPEGVKDSIEHFRFIRRFPLDSFSIPRSAVTTSLIRALGAQVMWGAGNETRNIKEMKEMVELCNELVSNELDPEHFPTAAFQSLRAAASTQLYRGLPTQLLDEVIACLRHAVKVCSSDSLDVVSFALAFTLSMRFMKTHSIGDYEEVMALSEKILDPNGPGGCPEDLRSLTSSLTTTLAHIRSVIFQQPEYLEVAISRLRAVVSSPSIGEGLRLQFAANLADRTRARFREYSLPESFEEANSYTSQLVDISSSQGLENSESEDFFLEPEGLWESHSTERMAKKIQHFEELLLDALSGTERHKECLRNLADLYKSKFHRTNDISDIEESIKYRQLLLDATHASEVWRIDSLSTLCDTLLLAFGKTRKISYFNESITINYKILGLETAQRFHFLATQRLVSSLLFRERVLGRIEDRHEAIRLISVVINNQYVQEPYRLQLSCQWATLARSIGHPTTLDAYKSAMSLMQKSLSFAPTVSVQHTRLITMGENCQTMPLDYASFQIDLGRFEEAIETLEQGRALLWSEMRSLRTPMAQPIEEEMPLAKRFTEINRELEALTVSITPSGRPEVEDGVSRDRDGTDPFGRLVVKQQKLVEERDALISQIQGRPGLEGLLGATSFTSLRSASSCGPVIVINHCKWRSDILILSHSSPPCSISTIDDFYNRANKLRDELVKARKHGLDSEEYQNALGIVLKGLYKLVGKPVIKKLRMLGVPEQSRIWWCPTSVFCSLPLHAMGPIPSSNACKQYFSDLYIPSYTPSLSALIESRKGNPQILEKPTLLLVGQPDDNLPGVKGEIKAIRKLEERVTVLGLVSSEATPTSVVEGLRCSQLAHFACHGVLEAGKPFEASFKLHGGSRLTLLEIVRSRLPDAEFAFLSCCHTAEITEKSLDDEALHLTAAMQYCGFRSVVGTMWEMADTDGQDLARNFYKSLFSSQETAMPYYERSAVALRDATQKLREKRGITLERWVNFVHYGA